jgi:hypothetical protein
LHGESIHPVTTKIQASFLAQLPDFIMMPMVTLKQLQSIMGVIWELRMDQQHCSYSTILT